MAVNPALTTRNNDLAHGLNLGSSLFSFADLTPEEAKAMTSESGYGVTLDGLHPYWPGISCLKCGRFVGRDGWIGVEHFEMSSEVASVEGECKRCLDAG